jgi:hypothetical protein
MSLLEKSEQIFNKIRNNPSVDEIEKLIRQFKASDNGVINKIYPTPLLGLLLRKAGITNSPSPHFQTELFSSLAETFLTLDATKRQILVDICIQIFRLNELCIEPLKMKELPHYSFILNPYNRFPDVMGYYKINISEAYEHHLMSSNEEEEIASIFQETPAFKYALSTLPEVRNNPLQIHCEQAVIQLNESLLKAKPRKSINIFGILGEKKIDIFNQHIISLLCIKDSLANLNQLLFQALTQNKMSVINSDDIIHFLASPTESGAGIAIKYLIHRAELYIIELCDLVRLNLGKYGLENTLCRVESHILGGTFTDTVDIDARIIDKNLNAYGKLISKFTDDKEKN